MPDVLSPNAHTFLVPDEGFSAIAKLHDRLYTSLLAPYRRPEIPFVPHITVGKARHAAECQQLANTLNEQEFAIHGSIERLTVVRYAGGQVTMVVDLPLAGRGVGQV
jgi:2'-5' RNA ligase